MPVADWEFLGSGFSGVVSKTASSTGNLIMICNGAAHVRAAHKTIGGRSGAIETTMNVFSHSATAWSFGIIGMVHGALSGDTTQYAMGLTNWNGSNPPLTNTMMSLRRNVLGGLLGSPIDAQIVIPGDTAIVGDTFTLRFEWQFDDDSDFWVLTGYFNGVEKLKWVDASLTFNPANGISCGVFAKADAAAEIRFTNTKLYEP